MRCNICDKQLTDKEISWNKDLGTFEPCSFCLEAAMDAAYSDGFQHSDDSDTEESTGGLGLLVGEESTEEMVEFISFKDYQPLGHTLTGED